MMNVIEFEKIWRYFLLFFMFSNRFRDFLFERMDAFLFFLFGKKFFNYDKSEVRYMLDNFSLRERRVLFYFILFIVLMSALLQNNREFYFIYLFFLFFFVITVGFFCGKGWRI